jgi:hypothetical protein
MLHIKQHRTNRATRNRNAPLAGRKYGRAVSSWKFDKERPDLKTSRVLQKLF